MLTVLSCIRRLVILYFLSLNVFVISGQSLKTSELAENSISHELPLNSPTDSNVVLIEDSSDSLTSRVSSQYSEWIMPVLSARILLFKAEEKGYIASSKECQQRLLIYNKAFPGVEVHTSLIEDEIVLEKYLNSEARLFPDIQRVNWCYQEYLKSSPILPPSPQTLLNPLLNSRALFTMDSVKLLCDKITEIQQAENDKQANIKHKPWGLDEMSLPLESSVCLAEKPDNECVVTVNEFNCFAAFNKKNSHIPLAIARKMVLVELLRTKFCSQKADSHGLSFNTQFQEKMEAVLDDQLLPHEYSTSRYDDSIEVKLGETYNKYYNQFFRDKITKLVELIGSTDSVYLDSLIRIDQRRRSDPVPKGGLSAKSPFVNSLFWRKLSSEELPDCILQTVDTLRRGQISGLIKTPFGFFVCKVIKVERRAGVSFRDAYNKVRYLYNLEQKLSNGQPDSVLAREYYDRNKTTYSAPDTLFVTSWLIPGTDTLMLQAKNDSITVSNDTAKIRPLRVQSTHLPTLIQNALLKRYNDSLNKSGFIGPLHCHLGTWYFLINKRMPGGKPIPFNLAINSIYPKLLIQSFPFDSLFSTESGRAMKKQMINNTAYQKYIYLKSDTIAQALSDSEIKKLITNKTINIAYKSGKETNRQLCDIARGMVRDQMQQQYAKEIENWLQSIRIKDSLLSDKSIVDNKR